MKAQLQVHTAGVESAILNKSLNENKLEKLSQTQSVIESKSNGDLPIMSESTIVDTQPQQSSAQHIVHPATLDRLSQGWPSNYEV